jgi:predicted GNAT family acetyltransferase
VSNDVTIRRIRTDDAGRARALRLEMLADTPLAFLTTLAEAAATPHDESVGRATRGSTGGQVAHFIAESGRRLVGQVVAMESGTDPDVTMLFAVYVTPACRGGSVVAGLIDAVAEWSRECGRKRLELEVVTTNRRATRAYQKIGFQAVGDPVLHPTISTLTEQVMTRAA